MLLAPDHLARGAQADDGDVGRGLAQPGERLGPVGVEAVVGQHDLGDPGIGEHGAGAVGEARRATDQRDPRDAAGLAGEARA